MKLRTPHSRTGCQPRTPRGGGWARCCRAEYMTVFACDEALTRTLEGTELQEGVLENNPYLGLSAEEDDKLFWPEARRCRNEFGHELLRLIVYPKFPRMKKEYL